MEFFDATTVAIVNQERTDLDKATSEKAATETRHQIIGQAIEKSKSLEDAQAAVDAAVSAKVNNFRVWYEIDAEVMYPAAIAWLKANGQALIELSSLSESELANRLLKGDKAAAFALRCRTYAMNNLYPLVQAGYWDEAWDLAVAPRAEIANDSNALAVHELALEAARLFVTECLHQATGQPMGIHISDEPKRWKL